MGLHWILDFPSSSASTRTFLRNRSLLFYDSLDGLRQVAFTAITPVPGRKRPSGRRHCQTAESCRGQGAPVSFGYLLPCPSQLCFHFLPGSGFCADRCASPSFLGGNCEGANSCILGDCFQSVPMAPVLLLVDAKPCSSFVRGQPPCFLLISNKPYRLVHVGT